MTDEEFCEIRDHLAAVRRIVERSVVLARIKISAEAEPLASDVEHVGRLEILRFKVLDARAWLAFLYD